MAKTTIDTDQRWACEQIEKYRSVYPRYVACAQTLRQVLEKAANHYAPLAIVQTRPKSIASFAEKAQRKMNKYRDPLNRMTDLCGGRVITQTQSEVNVVCKFIEKHFDIDWGNSVDVSQRLKPTEFGYRSVHYVIQFRRGVFPTKEIAIEIPDEVFPEEDCPMKAEIQVRTVVEHAWATFAHDRAYKGAFTIPAKWQRELTILAGMLEEVDQSFSRIQTGLRTYAANYGAYLDEEQARNEIEILETVLTCDPQNTDLAYRIGKLAMTLGNWEKAKNVFSKFVESGYQPILRDLGVVLCKIYAKDPTGPQYRQGQEYLRIACEPPNLDVDALASYAGTWKALDEERARSLYQQAFAVDPSDPYAVSNYLVYEIAYRRDLTPVGLMKPAINTAIQRSRDQADVSMNLPWAFYNLGIFYLLLGQPYDSLAAYAKAIQLSTNDWMIVTSLRLLDQLTVVQKVVKGYGWVRRLLLLGHLAKFPNETTLKQVENLASANIEPFSSPIVIVAGGCDDSLMSQIRGYRQLLTRAFRDFNGTILSGGTTAGVSGLIGRVQQTYPKTLRSVGYVPKFIPAGVLIDKRYSQIQYTEGDDFSALEPLQSWIDLMASGIQPSQVKLLGINGGMIAAAEYRIALALGATVAIIEESGREAAKLFYDSDWGTSKSLLRLPADAMSVRAFVGSGSLQLEINTRETIARAIHEAYRDEQVRRQPGQDPSRAEWDKLPNNFQESNRQQADHIQEKLHQIGCTLEKVEDRNVSLFKFTDSEIETMAEMEHGRWVVERLQDGWTWAEERDVIKKINPYIVSWSQLPEEVKEWDRETVRKIPEFLATVGMEIRRKEKP